MLLSLGGFLLAVGLSIVAHELGHLVAARSVGVKVFEFSLGMGPALFSADLRGSKFSIRAFPLGGFVRLAGMEEERAGESFAPGEGFSDKGPLSRMWILSAGSLVNALVAVLVFSLYLSLHGVYDLGSTAVGSVARSSPAEAAGLAPGDVVLEVDGVEVKDWGELSSAIARLGGKGDLVLTVSRKGRTLRVEARARFSPELGRHVIGISPPLVRYGPLEAFLRSLLYSARASVEMVRGVVRALVGEEGVEVSGPVGIAVIAGRAMSQGLWAFLSFLAALSLNLGVINLFPLPALDGGRIAFVLLEMTGFKLDSRRENLVHTLGFLLLILAIAYVTWGDLVKLWRGDGY